MVIVAVCIGVLVGIVVGALGAGGGILSVPVLVYLLGQSPHSATAESLVIVGLTALVSMLSPGRSRYIRFRDGVLFGLLAIAGAVAGARVSPLVPGDVILILFAVLICAMGIVMLRKGIRGVKRQDSQDIQAHSKASGGPRSVLLIAAAAVVTGMMTGFFGVGGGFIVVPILVLVLSMPMREAAATSLLVMVITSISGLLTRLNGGVDIDWAVTMAFAGASMAGGFVGGPLSAKVRPEILTMIFGLLLILVGIPTGISAGIAIFS